MDVLEGHIANRRTQGGPVSVHSTVRQISAWLRPRNAGARPGGPRSSVGLDLGRHTLKAAEVVRSNGSFTVTRIGIMQTPPGAVSQGIAADPEALGPAIRSLLLDAGIRSKWVVTALGGQAAVIREIAIPDMPDGELEQAVTFEAERHLPAGVHEVRCQYRVVDRIPEDGQVKILLVASARELVDRHMAPVAMAGLLSSVMEVTPLSAVRAVRPAGGQDQGATVYADLGAEGADILVLDGERVRLARSIPIGGNSLTAAIAEAMSCDFTAAQVLKEQQAQVLADGGQSGDVTLRRLHEAILPVIARLSNELRRSVDFYLAHVRAGAISRVVLTGGTAKLRNLSSFLSEDLGLPVEIGNPFAVCNADASFSPEYLADVAPVLAVAVGLALRGART